MHNNELEQRIGAAVERLQSDLCSCVPQIEQVIWPWLESLARGRPVHQYFSADWGYPLFSIPYWLENQLAERVAPGFGEDWVYSTVNGYFYVRLIDDLMDGDGQANSQLLPSAAFFHSRFQSMYARHFDSRHPFWEDWDREWLLGQQAGLVDSRLQVINAETFALVSGTKCRAAKIPIDAVCRFYGRSDLVEPWSSFTDVMSKYIQMADDIFDWQTDFREGRAATFLLSEAKRRRRSGESRVQWFEREGLDWGLGLCLGWLDELEGLAQALDCVPIVQMLARRRTGLLEKTQSLRQGVSQFARLGAFFPPSE